MSKSPQPTVFNITGRPVAHAMNPLLDVLQIDPTLTGKYEKSKYISTTFRIITIGLNFVSTESCIFHSVGNIA